MVCKECRLKMKTLTQKELKALLKIRTPEQILHMFMKGSIKLSANQIDMLIDLKKNKDIS